MTALQIEQRKAHRDWLKSNLNGFTHALTLTLKPYRNVMTDYGLIRESLTVLNANKNLQFFTKRLNASLYGNEVKRRGKTIALMGLLEGQATRKLLHYHCAIGNAPEHMSDDLFFKKIQSAWEQTPFGNTQMKFTRLANDGWVNYIDKEIGLNYADVLDVMNLRLPTTTLT